MEEMTIPLQTVNKVIGLECVDSTQTLAKELALNGEEANTLVLACSQTGGRGRFERTFSAQEGGVYFTLILRPNKDVSHNGNLSVKVAEAVCDTLKLFDVKTKIKHPNDVLVWEPKTKKWKKICGILIETSAGAENSANQFMLVGVGVNVNNRLPASLKDVAASLKQLIGTETSKELFLDELLENFWRRYAEWEASSR